eukprot:SM000325S12638  [mRNA]  locus=s325:32546:35091:+ [translate_table: standard]
MAACSAARRDPYVAVQCTLLQLVLAVAAGLVAVPPGGAQAAPAWSQGLQGGIQVLAALPRRLRTTVEPPIVYDAGEESDVNLSDPITISMDEEGTGRARSSNQYGPGVTWTGKVKTPSGQTNGVVTTFYLSSLEGSKDQDEIDFEFLGNQQNKVQVNYYVSGEGGHETMIDLDFNTSEDFHSYAISYQSNKIIWSIDGDSVHEVDVSSGQALPSKCVYLYFSVWDASSINNGTWAGTTTWASSPYVASYQRITVGRQPMRMMQLARCRQIR